LVATLNQVASNNQCITMPQSKQKRRARSGANDLATTTLTDDSAVTPETPDDRIRKDVGVATIDGRVLVGGLQTEDAASYLSISIPTLRRQVRDGKLIPNRYTRHLIFSVKELNRWLEEGKVE
jgi:hypothetical protein